MLQARYLNLKSFNEMKEARKGFGKKVKELLTRKPRKAEKKLSVTGKGTMAETVANKEITKR